MVFAGVNLVFEYLAPTYDALIDSILFVQFRCQVLSNLSSFQTFVKNINTTGALYDMKQGQAKIKDRRKASKIKDGSMSEPDQGDSDSDQRPRKSNKSSKRSQSAEPVEDVDGARKSARFSLKRYILF